MRLIVEAEPFDSVDARRLIAALDAHLASRYPPEQRFGPNLKPEQLASGFGTFVIAREDGRAIGCGALRLLNETTAEVKRMYVEPELRGRGVAKEILERLAAGQAATGCGGTVARVACTPARGAGCAQRRAACCRRPGFSAAASLGLEGRGGSWRQVRGRVNWFLVDSQLEM
jgi:GNAT superfamily N-acetyltransferase